MTARTASRPRRLHHTQGLRLHVLWPQKAGGARSRHIGSISRRQTLKICRQRSRMILSGPSVSSAFLIRSSLSCNLQGIRGEEELCRAQCFSAYRCKGREGSHWDTACPRTSWRIILLYMLTEVHGSKGSHWGRRVVREVVYPVVMSVDKRYGPRHVTGASDRNQPSTASCTLLQRPLGQIPAALRTLASG